jgi:RimJ/RimL family protein N-acetyltransferase
MPLAITDGLVGLRAPAPGDARVLVAERDEEFYRWLGPGDAEPRPAACIHAGGRIVGWVDYDRDPGHDWLAPGEVNIGYYVFPADRGHGYATRAVRLLLRHLAVRTDYTVASLLIDPGNARSLALAARIAGAAEAAHPRGRYFRVPLTAPARPSPAPPEPGPRQSTAPCDPGHAIPAVMISTIPIGIT